MTDPSGRRPAWLAFWTGASSWVQNLTEVGAAIGLVAGIALGWSTHKSITLGVIGLALGGVVGGAAGLIVGVFERRGVLEQRQWELQHPRVVLPDNPGRLPPPPKFFVGTDHLRLSQLLLTRLSSPGVGFVLGPL